MQEKYKPFLWLIAGILLFQSFWMRDFSYQSVVTLPFWITDYTISGYNWYLLSLIYEYIGLTILLVTGNRLTSYIFVIFLLSDTALFVNYRLNLSNLALYGLIWNDILYLIMLPSLVIWAYKNLE